MSRILSCTFPFPSQTPPTQVAQPCVQCPNADRAVLDLHSSIERDDPELLAAIRSFAKWFFAGDAAEDHVEEHVRYATDLYTREDHSGTCVPKTILFAYYKGMQFSSGGVIGLSDAGGAALKGLPVGSWPDGELRSGETFGQLFEEYGRRYD